MKNRNRGIGAFFRSWSEYHRFNKLGGDHRSIVFYAETGQDWHHLEPYVSGVTARGRTVVYVTSDRDDPAFSQNNPNLVPFFMKNGFWLITFFRMCAVDLLVLTMTDLGSFHIKRSVYPVHYCYLFHAMGSTHMVDFAESYDGYDTILCSGPHQIREIRAREKAAGLPAKNLVPHGYARVEQLAAEKANCRKKHDPTRIHVLVAPTWGPNSILNVCGGELIDRLMEAGFHVTLRPHWQTVKLSPGLVERIVGKHSGSPRFCYEPRMGDNRSLLESDILVCDWSSASIEYALGLEQPVLYVDVPKRVRNEQYESLGCVPLEISIRGQVGRIIAPDKLDGIAAAVRELVANPVRTAEEIRRIREEAVFNFGSAVKAGTDAIIGLAEQYRGKGSSRSVPPLVSKQG